MTTHTSAGQSGTVWVAPTVPEGQVISFQPGVLRIGEQAVSLVSGEAAPRSGALAIVGSHFYATAAELTTRRRGLHIALGAPTQPAQSEHWQQVLWRCDEVSCQRHILDEFDTAAGPEMLAVSVDGRALIVRQDRILLVSADR